MTDAAEIKLQPCPFCGGECEYRGGPCSYILCLKCGAQGPAFRGSVKTISADVERCSLAFNKRDVTPLLKRCDTALETADGIMGGEADDPDGAAWITEAEQIRAEIAERVK